MKKFLLIPLVIFFHALCTAQTAKFLSESNVSVADFISQNSDFKEIGDKLLNEAIAEYEKPKGKQDLAEEKFWYGKFFEYAALSKQTPPKELIAFFLENSAVCVEFSQTLSQKDNIENVFKILSDIFGTSEKDFLQFPRLACAIAVVFDMPPPIFWPHAQVSEKALKRDLGDPVKAFKTRLDSRRRGKTLIQTEKLNIEELKYLVSSLATDEDRDWAFKEVSFTINTLPKLYPSIEYSFGRIKAKQFDWLGADYSLKNIKKTGGICVDQAYYTSENAKLRGLPSFIFSGAGSDGFHAWVAYMQKSGKWNFDVGRYEGAMFVTGHTLDPQTWQPASDHALNAMRESFRENAKYKLNLLHTAFAKRYLELGEFKKAAATAKKGIDCDVRNADTWNTLIDAQEKSEAPQKDIVNTYQNAIKAFGRYPDIEAEYRRRLIAILSDSNPALARKISTQMISKTKSARPDIAMEFARRNIEADIDADNLDKLSTNYKQLLAMFKSNPVIAINGLTIPILNKLLSENKSDKCDVIIKATRQSLRASKDSAVEVALLSLEEQILAIKSKLKK